VVICNRKQDADIEFNRLFTACMTEGLAVGGEGVDYVLLLPLSEYTIQDVTLDLKYKGACVFAMPNHLSV
jgi:hypothetical protein